MKMIRLMMLWIVALCAAICSAETFSYNGCEYRTVEDTEFGKSVALVSFNRDIAENGELVLDSRVFKDGDEEGYSVVQIEERTLSKLQTVKSIIFPEKLLEIKNINISNLPLLESVRFGQYLKSIGEECFVRLPNLKEISFPESLENIGEWSFNSVGFTHLTVNAVYPMGIAFNNLPELETLELSCRGSIGNSCFCNLPKLTRVVIPKVCREIYTSSFQDLPLLEEIVLPDNPDLFIDSSVFWNCPSVKKIFLEGMEPPRTDDMRLSGSYEDSLKFEDITLYVPYGSKEAYESNPCWNIYGSIVEYDPAGTEKIEDSDKQGTVKAVPGGVEIDNPTNEPVRITDMLGRAKDYTDCSRVDLAPGLYIVTLGSKSEKIAVM